MQMFFFIYSLFLVETTDKSVHCGVVWWPASCCTQDSMSVVKQLKRPVAVIPQCSYPETRSLETAGMSSFSPSLFQTFSLLVSLSFLCRSHFLSVRSWHVQAKVPQRFAFAAVPSPPCTPIWRERAHPSVRHTHTRQSVIDTEANANKGSDACGKMRKQRGAGRHPLLFAPSHINTYKLCCHDSRFPLMYFNMVLFPCCNSSLKSIPALPCSLLHVSL